MEQRLTIITFGVADLKISTEFYEQKFGWKKLNSGNDNIIFFKLNGIILALFPRERLAEDAQVDATGAGFKGYTLAYNTRAQPDVDTIFAQLAAQDVPIVKQPAQVDWGGYSGYIADPDDNLWEIAYNPFLPLDARGDVFEQLP